MNLNINDVKLLNNSYYDELSSDCDETIDSDQINQLSNHHRTNLLESCYGIQTENSDNLFIKDTNTQHRVISSNDNNVCVDYKSSVSCDNKFKTSHIKTFQKSPIEKIEHNKSENINYLICSSSDEDCEVKENKNNICSNLPSSSFWTENHDVYGIENSGTTPKRVRKTTLRTTKHSNDMHVHDTPENTNKVIKLNDDVKVLILHYIKYPC